MDADLPTREAILAAETPAALFGSAVDDPRALRRAYASLVRAFSAEDDPEVFQRIRRLFDEARAQRVPGGEPEPQLPADGMQAALQSGDAQRVFDALTGATDALVASRPDLVHHALRILLWNVGPTLGPGALDAVELVVLRPDLDLPPGDALEMELDLLRLRALRLAVLDEAVPDALVTGIRRSWCRRADVQAEAWLEAAEALQAAEVDLDRLFAHLEAAHPTVLGLVHQTELRIVLAAPPSEFLPDDELTRLRRRYPPYTALWERQAGPWALVDNPWLGFGVRAVIFFVVLRATGGLILSVGAAALGRYALHHALVAALTRLDEGTQERLYEGGAAPLLDLARSRGLFPSELAEAVAPVAPVAVHDRFRAYPPQHPLLQLASEPAGLLRVLTAAHVARVRRGLDEGASASSADG